MKQILQNLRTGDTTVVDVPCPRPDTGRLVIRTTRSLISAGTERMLVDFGRASLVGKARRQPDKVRRVVEKARTDGWLPALEAVRDRLDQPLPMGYCNVGIVDDVGEGVGGFERGDRVVSNGRHAEMVSVPITLCARIPDGVSDEAAVFAVIGAIALQGIRLAEPTLGECFVVTGLGVIGLLAVQLLRAHGCRVLGVDVDESRLALARRVGAETMHVADTADLLAAADRFSRGRGVDGVLLTLAGQDSSPVSQAARMCRKRGRIVLVGVTGLDLNRDDFYEKELSFQVSCSYGPGRGDPGYEEKGQDYPVGFIRWTARRNFEAVLDMLASGQIDVTHLISHRFKLHDAGAAYAVVTGKVPSLGILLEYPGEAEAPGRVTAERVVLLKAGTSGAPAVSFLGTGSYATAVLVPAFKAAGARLVSAASNTGVSAAHAGRKYGFDEATTDTNRLVTDPAVDAVVVSTRHDSHARFVLQALAAGKHVFVEKPLCLNREELAAIETAWSGSGPARPIVMVGFNRRFAPHVRRIKALLADVREPKSFILTVNAGAVPSDHWTQDPAEGGGRIVGESCHFIDLLRFLASSPIVSHCGLPMASRTGDTLSVDLAFQDGSIGTIHYFANGSRAFPKERLEVFVASRVLQLDNFQVLRGYGWPGFRTMRRWRQDKGQRACVGAFLDMVRTGGPSPIPFEELHEVSRVAIELASRAHRPTPSA